jgi:hypothetical protein
MTPQTSPASPTLLQRALAPLAKAIAIAMATAMALAITACGPGTGGTGVGPTAGTYISVSSSTGSPLVTGAATSATAGTGYALVLDPLAIRLVGACLAFGFEGPWAETNGEIRVTGSYRLAAPASDLALAPSQAGTLIARAENTGFTVSLLDARGMLLLGFATGAKLADGVSLVPTPACKALPAEPMSAP